MLFDTDAGGSGVDTGDIGHSLRCRSAASTYLSRAFTTPTDNKKFTIAGFVKRGKLGVAQAFFPSKYQDATNYTLRYFNSSDQIVLSGAFSGLSYSLTTAAVFRDPTAAIHIMLGFDSNNATQSSRCLLYVNGALQALTGTSVSSGQVDFVNTVNTSYIGVDLVASNYFDGYLSRICFVDGQVLTPSSFIQFNTEINEWVSKSQSAVKAVVDAGGTNSFMLDFDNATSLTTLGYDKSSKGNNWTLNNFSLTAGTTYDHMLDVPGNSYCALNPLSNNAVNTLSNANTGWSSSSATAGSYYSKGSLSTGPSGKWFFEVYPTDVGVGPNLHIGIQASSVSATSGGASGDVSTGYAYYANGNKLTGTSYSAYGATYAASDVIGVAVDVDGGTVEFYKNGVSQGVAFSGIAAQPYVPLIMHFLGGGATRTSAGTVACGQAPLHASATYDSASGGYFRYAPPSGFKALCQRNMPDISPTTLLDPTDHHIDITVTKSGDTNFTLPWNADTYDTFFEIKRRDSTGDWYQIDGLRGYTKILKSNSTAAETTDANVLGISGTTGTLKSTLTDGTYIISATKAGLSAARQTNTDGSITSTVSRNVDSGFSIVTYGGNSVAGATVGHGLGATPKYVQTYMRTGGTENRAAWHVGLTSGTYYINLNLTGAQVNDNSRFYATPTSTVLSFGGNSQVSATGYTYVAYCYADSAIQKSFSYTGNASADGPYVNLGFKCGRVSLKCTNYAANWIEIDSVRDTYNLSDKKVSYSSASYENDPSPVGGAGTNSLDMVASAVKLRHTDTPTNYNGGTYIGHAWAATTGKYSLGR